MSTERETQNHETDLQKAVEYSRGFPNLGGVPDINLNTSRIGQTNQDQQTKKHKLTQEQDNYPWGFFSAMKKWLDGKIED